MVMFTLKTMNFTPTVQHILNFFATKMIQTMILRTSTTLPCLQYQANKHAEDLRSSSIL